jgi:DNA-binding ferritin-like protein (Dps family)
MDNKILRSFRDMRALKRTYRECKKRGERLPQDYKVVYQTASAYMLNFSSNDADVVNLLPPMLDLLESAAAEGRDVLEVVGDDVMAFCDGLLEGAQTWTGQMRAKMNDSIHKKLGR